MDLTLPREDLAWQERARVFAETVLFPQEIPLEEQGHLSPETKDAMRRAVVQHGLHGINHAKEVGGRGCTQLQQVLISEELGKSTGCLWAVVWHPAVPLKHGTPAQIETFLRPSCLGERRACVAITEPGAGSDTNMIATRADRRGDRYVLNGEKWFVTSAPTPPTTSSSTRIVDGDPAKPTIFLVDKATPGIITQRAPKFMHTYVFEHPELVFEDVEVGAGPHPGRDRPGARTEQGLVRRGPAADRRQLPRRRHPRLRGRERMGAASACSSASRSATCRRVEFMLADMAVEIMAAKKHLYRVAWEIDRGFDRKLVHARASVVKLYASEMAGRVRRQARCRCWAAAATCGRTRSSGCTATCASTASGKALRKSSA